MANDYIKPYHIAWAINILNQMIDACVDPGVDNNPALIGLDIDFNWTKYESAIYQLYETAEKLGIVDEVKEALREDEIDAYYFNEAEDDILSKREYDAQEDLMYSVRVGDKVRLYNGNVYYVADIDGNTMWVTSRLGDEQGWSAELSDVEEILESADDRL